MDYLSIGAIFEQENCWLDEWIRYHFHVGVEHFYLYNNDRDTRVSDRILLPYVERGLVENIHVREHASLKSMSKETLQSEMLKDVMARSRGRTRWLAAIDLDEFILPRSEESIAAILGDYEEYGALIVSWLRYGSSGRITRPPGQINHFLYHASMFSLSSRYFKSIVKPDLVDTQLMLAPQRIVKLPHVFPLHDGNETVNEKKKVIDTRSFMTVFTGDKIVLNHYALRSFQDFWEVKQPRGRFNGMPDFPPDHFEKLDENTIFNDEISRRFGYLAE